MAATTTFGSDAGQQHLPLVHRCVGASACGVQYGSEARDGPRGAQREDSFCGILCNREMHRWWGSDEGGEELLEGPGAPTSVTCTTLTLEQLGTA
jgi:hypothetical protein